MDCPRNTIKPKIEVYVSMFIVILQDRCVFKALGGGGGGGGRGEGVCMCYLIKIRVNLHKHTLKNN